MATPETNTRFVTLIAAGAALGGFLFGFDTSTMNAAIVGIRPTLELGRATVGFVAAIALIGAAMGAWFAGPLPARSNRNRVMFIAGALITVGALGVSLTGQVVLLGLFRLMVGLGIGAASAMVPPYISEVSPPDGRPRARHRAPARRPRRPARTGARRRARRGAAGCRRCHGVRRSRTRAGCRRNRGKGRRIRRGHSAANSASAVRTGPLAAARVTARNSTTLITRQRSDPSLLTVRKRGS